MMSYYKLELVGSGLFHFGEVDKLLDALLDIFGRFHLYVR
jgi:hypothetical protein